MTGERALEVFARAMIREMMGGPDAKPAKAPRARRAPQAAEVDIPPQPRFDFTPESDHEFEQKRRAELDNLMGVGDSTADAKAQRVRERRYPEDIPMRGMAPPEET